MAIQILNLLLLFTKFTIFPIFDSRQHLQLPILQSRHNLKFINYQKATILYIITLHIFNRLPRNSNFKSTNLPIFFSFQRIIVKFLIIITIGHAKILSVFLISLYRCLQKQIILAWKGIAAILYYFHRFPINLPFQNTIIMFKHGLAILNLLLFINPQMYKIYIFFILIR